MGLFLMCALKVVHLSPTPLVGAPGKIAWAQRSIGIDSASIIYRDYPSKGPLSGKFIDNSVIYSGENQAFCDYMMSRADIIHIHNFLPPGVVSDVASRCSGAKFVYHAHSPLREGPLYGERSDVQLPYDLKVYVGQYAGRFYNDFVALPNVIVDTPSLRLRQPGEKLRVMYSPTHSNSGRWNSKHSPELDEAIKALEKTSMVDVVFPGKPVPPNVLLQMRRTCHVSIDEIATGGFHQVSLEGLCAGNVVINRADYFSKYVCSGFSDGVFPPFKYSDGNDIFNVLLSLADSVEETARLQQESYNYFSKYMGWERLAGFYEAEYEKII